MRAALEQNGFAEAIEERVAALVCALLRLTVDAAMNCRWSAAMHAWCGLDDDDEGEQR